LDFHFCFKNGFSRSRIKFIFSVMTVNLFVHAILYPIWMLRVLLGRYFCFFNLHNMIEISFFTFPWLNCFLPNKDILVFPRSNRLWNVILW
jgi:hypothetical protein